MTANEVETFALVSFGYQQSKADYSLFTKKNAEGFTVVLVYVDDLMITGNDAEQIANLKRQLSSQFHMKDLGALHYFLGLEVTNGDSDLLYTSEFPGGHLVPAHYLNSTKSRKKSNKEKKKDPVNLKSHEKTLNMLLSKILSDLRLFTLVTAIACKENERKTLKGLLRYEIESLPHLYSRSKDEKIDEIEDRRKNQDNAQRTSPLSYWDTTQLIAKTTYLSMYRNRRIDKLFLAIEVNVQDWSSIPIHKIGHVIHISASYSSMKM
ncbi:retrovirus-related pol polyprotein from transposon TNT 1-94 [Tanacetum coccineum]|uniref:Retrovirus-related pol polyprotein from transposon TNT 1-94 n=1 Tax=Tanacetum coccineum TaxID=301880 RepID=A0ABQ5IH07_9ASTR